MQSQVTIARTRSGESSGRQRSTTQEFFCSIRGATPGSRFSASVNCSINPIAARYFSHALGQVSAQWLGKKQRHQASPHPRAKSRNAPVRTAGCRGKAQRARRRFRRPSGSSRTPASRCSERGRFLGLLVVARVGRQDLNDDRRHVIQAAAVIRLGNQSIHDTAGRRA